MRFARRQKIEKRGAYLWRDGQTLRILLVGNKPFCNEVRDEQYRNLRSMLNRLITPAGLPYTGFTRLRLNYVSLTLTHVDDYEAVVESALNLIRAYLGWDAIPVLGVIETRQQFDELQRSHHRRWNLAEV